MTIDKQIYYCEDIEVQRELVERGINSTPGLKCTSFETADDLLLALSGDVDLVLSDLNMPGEHSGYSLARALHGAHVAIPVIILTGNANFDPQVQKARQLPNVRHVLSKPIRIPVLIETLQDTLGVVLKS